MKVPNSPDLRPPKSTLIMMRHSCKISAVPNLTCAKTIVMHNAFICENAKCLHYLISASTQINFMLLVISTVGQSLTHQRVHLLVKRNLMGLTKKCMRAIHLVKVHSAPSNTIQSMAMKPTEQSSLPGCSQLLSFLPTVKRTSPRISKELGNSTMAQDGISEIHIGSMSNEEVQHGFQTVLRPHKRLITP